MQWIRLAFKHDISGRIAGLYLSLYFSCILCIINIHLYCKSGYCCLMSTDYLQLSLELLVEGLLLLFFFLSEKTWYGQKQLVHKRISKHFQNTFSAFAFTHFDFFEGLCFLITLFSGLGDVEDEWVFLLFPALSLLATLWGLGLLNFLFLLSTAFTGLLERDPERERERLRGAEERLQEGERLRTGDLDTERDLDLDLDLDKERLLPPTLLPSLSLVLA